MIGDLLASAVSACLLSAALALYTGRPVDFGALLALTAVLNGGLAVSRRIG